MEHKQQVSLEIAKQLKKAGYKQEGIFWWVFDNPDKKSAQINYKDNKPSNPFWSVVAPTAGDMIEKLKNKVSLHITYGEKIGYRVHASIVSVHGRAQDLNEGIFETDRLLHDAVAKIWLCLRKMGVL